MKRIEKPHIPNMKYKMEFDIYYATKYNTP